MAVVSRLREIAVDRRHNRSDRILFGTMLALSGFGLLMIYSATSSAGSVGMERQMIFVAAGLTVYLIVSNIDYREFKNLIPMISVLVLIGLFAVYLFPPINGSRRWIPLGLFNLQPAEFAKVMVILLLAALPGASRGEGGPPPEEYGQEPVDILLSQASAESAGSAPRSKRLQQDADEEKETASS